MITPPPYDPNLPGLATLLDEDAVMELVEARLRRTEPFDILGCRPRYIRYKPAASCLVQYDLAIRDAAGERVTTSAHITMFHDDRAVRISASAAVQRLEERATRLQKTLPFERSAYLPEAGGLLQIYPLDRELHFLVRASDTNLLNKELRKSRPDLDSITITAEPEMVRYKPERKALLRYVLDGGPVTHMYGKVHADDRIDRVHAFAGAFGDAGLRTPAVLLAAPRRKFIAHAEVDGVSLKSLRGSARYTVWMEPMAEALERLQSVELAGAANSGLVGVAAEIKATANYIGQIAPHLGPRLESLNDHIAAHLADVDGQETTCHGDFYDDQAMVSDDRLTIIDLDEVRVSHPLTDAGNLLAHLSVAEIRGEGVGEAREAFRELVLHREGFTERDVTLFEGVAVFKLAPGPFRRLEHEWPLGIERIVCLAEEVLAPLGRAGIALPANGSGARANGQVTDASLPQLQALQDRVTMSAQLTRVAGEAVTVSAIDLVRHKVGRRAILRYELEIRDRRDVLYGKTFGSDRGPKVHQIVEQIARAKAFGPDVALPEPVAFLPGLKLLAQRVVTGEPVERALLGGDVQVASDIADLLHRFHTSGLDLGRSHDLPAELKPLTTRVEQVSTAVPELAGTGEFLLHQIKELGWNDLAWRYRPVHRDFYHAQLLIDGRTLAVLDLDDAAMSEPAVDIANFVAHLRLLDVHCRDYTLPLETVERTFIERYRTLDPDLDAEMVRFLTATTLVRLAGIHVSRKDGRRVARKMLKRALGQLNLRYP